MIHPTEERRMRTLRIIPLLMLLAACSDTAGPSARAVRVSAQVNGAAQPGENVTVTIENRGSRPLLLPNCGERVLLTVERRIDDRWEPYSGEACLTLAIYAPLELAPGASLSTTRAVWNPGEYRIRLRAWHQDDPESARTVVSEEFDIP
jgi:hypothetical protein